MGSKSADADRFAEFTLEEGSDEGLRMTLLLIVTISPFLSF